MIVPVGDRYVKAGSTVKVDCQITDVVQLPDYIFWYHEDKRVMDRHDPNLLVAVKRTDVEAITSTFTIHKVRQEQSGNYTCMPSNLHAASVTLHVLNEKHPAAMQGERNSATSTHESRLPLTLALLVCVLVWAMSLGSEGENNNNNNNNKTSNKINSTNNNNNNDISTTEVDEPFRNTSPPPATITTALVSSCHHSLSINNPNHHHHLPLIHRPMVPLAPPALLTSPTPPSVFPFSDQEHEKMMIELVCELLQLDHLTAAPTTTTAQGDDYDNNNTDYVQGRVHMTPTPSTTTTTLVLSHVDDPQMVPQNKQPFSCSFSKTKETGGHVLEEALGLHMLGMEEVWGKVIEVNDSYSWSEAKHHHTCLGDSATVAHQQIKIQDSSVTEANNLRCRNMEEEEEEEGRQVLSTARQR
ncbi:hypothetical protein Pmani_023763 [Petrolisthes manimaculis]|uniref:Ig-like domain-containing protein n=1 Tax=Petrolisthes manimaculis TaxID=1843537 RepID=A0AAE1PBQ9_9EUCA|nr:hypothetical protein Pmani_023763 [Petrolisthes manimaculis]